jgi:hypothetical protein
MFTCDRQLHFLASHEQRPWVRGCFIFCDILFLHQYILLYCYCISRIFYICISYFLFFYDLCFVICKTFVKKTFSLYNSKQFIQAYGNCTKLLINVCREINVKSTNFLNFSSNFFYFGQLLSNFYAF